MKELIKKLAEASNWNIPDDRIEEIVAAYKATIDDTRPVRELILGSSVPGFVDTSCQPTGDRHEED